MAIGGKSKIGGQEPDWDLDDKQDMVRNRGKKKAKTVWKLGYGSHMKIDSLASMVATQNHIPEESWVMCRDLAISLDPLCTCQILLMTTKLYVLITLLFFTTLFCNCRIYEIMMEGRGDTCLQLLLQLEYPWSRSRCCQAASRQLGMLAR